MKNLAYREEHFRVVGLLYAGGTTAADTEDVGGGIVTISFPSRRSNDAKGDERCDTTSTAPPRHTQPT